jgi:hypothetical protein
MNSVSDSSAILFLMCSSDLQYKICEKSCYRPMLIVALVGLLRAGSCTDGGLEAFWGTSSGWDGSMGCYATVDFDSAGCNGTAYAKFRGSFVAKESGSHAFLTWRESYCGTHSFDVCSAAVTIQFTWEGTAYGYNNGGTYTYTLTQDFRYRVEGTA